MTDEQGRRRSGALGAAAVAAVALTVSACGGSSPHASRRGVATNRGATTTVTAGHHGAGEASAPSTTTPAPPKPKVLTVADGAAQPGWTVVAASGPRVRIDERSITVADGAMVTLLRFRAHAVRFSLHVGSSDPPTSGHTIPAGAASAVDAAQRATLLAGFNGGFKVGAGGGGMEVGGQVLTPLQAGEATLVVGRGGSARIGVWGSGTPRPGEVVVDVRQNLPPLIRSGVAATDIGDIAAWGDPLGGVANPARSALGQDRAGDLIYAGSMRAYPSDLTDALLAVGTRTAMELDINPYWVGAEVASRRGGPLRTVVPGQNRPADQYLVGWERDFVSVGAR